MSMFAHLPRQDCSQLLSLRIARPLQRSRGDEQMEPGFP